MLGGLSLALGEPGVPGPMVELDSRLCLGHGSKQKGVFLFLPRSRGFRDLSSFWGKWILFPPEILLKKFVHGFTKKAVPGERHPREVLQTNRNSRNAEGGGQVRLCISSQDDQLSKIFFWIGCGRREGGRSEHITTVKKEPRKMGQSTTCFKKHGLK